MLIKNTHFASDTKINLNGLLERFGLPIVVLIRLLKIAIFLYVGR